MKIFDMFRRKPEARSRPSAAVDGLTFTGFDDPALLEFIRTGQMASDSQMLKNTAALRCLTLICNGVGMLPVSLYASGDEKRVMKEHPAHKLLRVRPNPYQTPMEFKSQMELLLETEGNAYARIIRSGTRPIHLIPFEKGKIEPKLGSDYRMKYVHREGGVTYDQSEILHLRDLSLDGVEGVSRRELSREVFDLADQAQKAALSVFTTGVMAGGSIEIANALSEQAYLRMRASLASEYSGSENMKKWMILEEGAKANQFASTAADAQQVENRNHQIEEVARLYGVPRPLLMMDDTSWGSGIEQLAIFFIQYTLAPRFVMWEQALSRALLTDAERENLYFKFNERALMRGTLKDQADYFAKALGAGGHQPWHSADEVRDLLDYPASDLPHTSQIGEPASRKASNEPQTTT